MQTHLESKFKGQTSTKGIPFAFASWGGGFAIKSTPHGRCIVYGRLTVGLQLHASEDGVVGPGPAIRPIVPVPSQSRGLLRCRIWRGGSGLFVHRSVEQGQRLGQAKHQGCVHATMRPGISMDPRAMARTPHTSADSAANF